MKWQPIETAPKDATSILAYEPECLVRRVIHWAIDEPWVAGPCWIDSWNGDNLIKPTHWMPLPAPPQK